MSNRRRIVSGNFDAYGHTDIAEDDGYPRKIPSGWHQLRRPNPPTYQYSYSNEASQNSLICQTPGFPDSYNPKTHEVAEAYSDRMCGWDRERFNRACEIAGSGEQAWAYRLPGLGHEKLIEFAKVALNIEDCEVTAVRVVHHFNVSNGYSCPTVCAVYEKKK